MSCMLVPKILFFPHEAVLSASFYGASYAEFPPISVGDDFDISFSFRTSFPEGLIIYSGNVSEVGND